MAKKVAKKVARKKAIKKAPPAKKVAAKKAAQKKAPAKKEVLGSAGQLLPRDMDENGFVRGSNTAIIVETMLEGAKDRQDLNEKIIKALKGKTKAEDIRRNVPSMVAGILRKLAAEGYEVESSWTLVKGEKKSSRKGVKKIASTPSKSKSAPSKAVPKKKVAKKVAKRK